MKHLLTLTTLLLSFTLHAGIIRVDIDSPVSNPNGNSWATAYTNMYDAYLAASNGDQIWVAEGTYATPQALFMGRGIQIYCGFEGWEFDLSQRDWENNVVTFTQSFNTYNISSIIAVSNSWNNLPAIGVLDGAHFLGWGFTNNMTRLIGAGVPSELTFRNCVFENLFLEDYLITLSNDPSTYSSEFLFDNCEFSAVHVGDEAVNEWEEADCVFNDCAFNTCVFGSDVQHEAFFKQTTLSNTSFKSCVFEMFSNWYCTLNSCLMDQCTFTTTFPVVWVETTVVNSTLVNNTMNNHLVYYGNFTNTIFYGNVSNGGETLLFDPFTIVINCILQEPFDGAGGNYMVADPMFVDPDNGDWHLTECSPAVDNTSINISLVDTDLDGNPRVVNNELDMGCYEYAGDSKWVVYVDKDATGANDGTSWEDAFISLHDALSNTCDHSEIWIAEGMYWPNENAGVDRYATFSLGDNTKIYGGFAGFETYRSQRDVENNNVSISGYNGTTSTTTDDAFHVFTIASGSENIVIDGVRITFGRADGTGTFASGGGVYMSGGSALIQNCSFQANNATLGGAIFATQDAQLEVRDCEFAFNTATQKGGALCVSGSGIINSATTIDRSTFLFNNAANGGGIYADGGQYIFANSLLQQNTATVQGDGMEMYGSIELFNSTVYGHEEGLYVGGTCGCYNSIFWENDDDFAYMQGEASIQVKYSCMSSTTPGEGNISANPNFASPATWDFNLTVDSPCINNGSSDFIYGELDIDGDPRIHDTSVDMGAYEFNLPCAPPNDVCSTATELDVSTALMLTLDMSCATPDADYSGFCGGQDARSRWYHFTMPDNILQCYLGDSPDSPLAGASFSLHQSCTSPAITCDQSLFINDFFNPGADVYVQVFQWGVPQPLKLNLIPLIPEIVSVAPTQQSDCYEDAPYSTYDQQIVVHHANTEAFSYFKINNTLFPIEASPQYIVLYDLIADGDFIDLAISVEGSNVSSQITDFVQTPCCAPSNDSCSEPRPIDADIPVIGKLDCATQAVDDVLSSCTTDPGRSLWYDFQAPPSGAVELECSIVQLNGPFNVRMSVWDMSDGCPDPVEVGCINALGDNQNESGIISGLNPNQGYQVMISGWQNQKGTFEFVFHNVESVGCEGDFNNDLEVNSLDLLLFLQDFGCSSNCGDKDFNGDAVVNSIDLLLFLAMFGNSCL
ncbi:MAG: hypothetical protein KDC12_02495 [Flavobacteriales bacterium]|nr:hypothetical protein [Flavobacteriales bacterium]